MRNKFKSISTVFYFSGTLLFILGIILLIPLLFVMFNDNNIETGYKLYYAFLIPGIISLILAYFCKKLFKYEPPKTYQAMLICCIVWILYSLIGALPFIIGIKASFIDAFFETMSGFTTTGITMFTNLDVMPESILFWRSLTQWIGGLGILTFILALASFHGGAHRLFGAEGHKINTQRLVPGLSNTIKRLWAIYIFFTVIIFIGLVSSNMSMFDSLCHSFTALSTGGFSPHDASIEYYRLHNFKHYILIEYILIFGMILGGTNFLIHYRILKGESKALFDNTEMKTWWILIFGFTAVIFFERIYKFGIFDNLYNNTSGFIKVAEQNFRIILFQVVSLITTTGFGTKDINLPFFGAVSKQIFIILMFVGGCVGSTGGGIKVLRISILFKLVKREVLRLFLPNRAVTAVVIDGSVINKEELYRVCSLFFAWIILILIGGLITAFLSNYSAYESFSGMFSALGNIGPCYIPVNELHSLHPVIKIVYIFGMLAGRLEILPVLLLFSAKAWKN